MYEYVRSKLIYPHTLGPFEQIPIRTLKILKTNPNVNTSYTECLGYFERKSPYRTSLRSY